MPKAPVKSPNDYREYRTIDLENGIKALLISDINHKEVAENFPSKETKKAAAALRINVGSFQDPKTVEGLAHFLEHMVFMGSKKYPTENEFSAYLKAHGGYSNAGTGYENTTFHFDVQPEHFEGALDRFAQFFVNPLLLENAVDREIKAVDSEFRQSLPEDTDRIEQLFCHLAKKDHPLSNFSWGNKESLKNRPKEKGIDVMKVLREFFELHYLNCQTTVAICSTETLDQLEEWCIKYFSPLAKRNPVCYQNLHSKKFRNPFEAEVFHKLFYVMPVKDYNLLELKWILPNQYKHYRAPPAQYVSWLISHKGEGSLYASLLKRGYISMLDGWYCNYSEFSEFVCSFELTNDGVNKIEEIVNSLFQYLKMLQKNGASERIFNQIKHATEISFKFLEPDEPEDYVENLVNYMQKYPDEEWITAVNLTNEYHPKLIEELQMMLSPDSVNIVVSSKSFNHLSKEEEEPWFKTKYSIKDIPKSWIDPEKYTLHNEEFFLPKDNQFLATNFDLKPPQEVNEIYPKLIRDSGNCKIWFKQDRKFKLPKAMGYLQINLPILGNEQHYNACASMVYWVLDYMSAELNHETHLALMHQSSSHSVSGCRTISIDGFNDKLLAVFKKHVDSLANFEFTSQAFHNSKQEYRRQMRNDFIDVLELSSFLYHRIMFSRSWNEIELLKGLEDLTEETFKEFGSKYFCKKLSIECLFQGNLLAEEVTSYIDYLCEALPDKTTEHFEEPEKIKVLKIPVGRTLFRHYGFNKKDPNSIIYNYYQVGPTTMRLRTIGQLLSDLMDEPTFDYLRTQEQLGYYVECHQDDEYGILGYSITVKTQKGKFSADEVDRKMEEFLLYFQKKLKDFTEEEYQNYVKSFVKDCRAADLCLSDEMYFNWSTISEEEYLFDLKERKSVLAESIEKKEVEEFLQKYLIDKNQRRKLSVQIVGHHDNQSDSESGSSDESGTDSENDEEENDEEAPEKMDCPDDLVIRQFDLVSVDIENTEQYDRCITDVDAFIKECGYFPYTKLTYDD